MLKKVSRRRFLASGFAVLLSGISAGAYFRQFDYEGLVVSVLRRRLSYLNLEESTLDRFAADFASEYGSFGIKGRLLALSRPLAFLFEDVDALEGELTKFEDRVVSRYLLSTNFFRNDADESSQVRYLAYYDPYDSGCGNPFATLGDE